MPARFVPSNVAEMVDWIAGSVSATSGMTIDLGTSGTWKFGTDLGLDTNNGLKVVYAGRNFAAPGGTTQLSLFAGESAVKGTSPAGPVSWARGLFVRIQDDATVVNKTITAMSRSGTTVTVTAAGHGFANGDAVAIYGVTHTFNAEINGWFQVANVAANTFQVTLAGLSSGSYTNGGTVTNRPSFYGAFFALGTNIDRGSLTGTAQFGDDANGVGVINAGTARATAGFLVNHRATFTGGTAEFADAFRAEGNAHRGFSLNGTYQWGIDLYDQTSGPTYTSGLIRLPNNVAVYGRNAADGADVELFSIDTSNQFKIAPIAYTPTAIRMGNNAPFQAYNAAGSATPTLFWYTSSNQFEIRVPIHLLDDGNTDIIPGTTNGSKIGTSSSQKIGFYGATPIVRPSSTTDLRSALIDLGLYTSGGATPLNLNGGDFTGASIQGTTLTLSAQANDLAMNSHKVTGLADGAASGEAVAWPLPLMGSLLNAQSFGPGANQTWVRPAVSGKVIVVFIKGGGGGGGGGVNSASAGNPRSGGAGGGGGGWLAFAVPFAAIPGNVNVNVASGGAGGTAGNAGSDSNRTTAFDSAGGNGNVTAATGGAAGSSGASTGGTGGVATAPTYSGYSVTSVATNGGTGGAGTTAASAGGNGATGSGGAGGGCSTTPTGQNGGTGNSANPTTVVSGAAGTGGATQTKGAPGVGPVFIPVPQPIIGGGGGGGCHTNGTGGGAGANGYAGGGGGGGGSCVNGSAGVGGAGGDGVVFVLVY